MSFQPFLAAGQGCGAERPHGLPPPPFRPPASKGSGRTGCCGPLGAGCSCSPLGVRSAPALLQPDSSPTPARLRSCSGPAPVPLRSCSGPAPALLRHASLGAPRLDPRLSRLSVPLSLGVPHSHDLAPPQVPVPAPLPPQLRHSPPPFLSPSPSVRQSVCLSASPPSFSFLCPASLACSLVRLGGAASQENPRNLCKKLTMKFKKFYDFGAIFEWSESFSRLDVGKVWLEGAEDVYIVRFGCGGARHL
nr:leucine-rich repeat extensin-like protein 3 [Peromyscus maniculatus bairdii]